VSEGLLAAIDVGTGSARAGLFTARGDMLARAEHKIAMQRRGAHHAEHDSEDIWRAVCAALRIAMDKAGARPGDVVGLSFDATCSLVVRDGKGGQVSVATSGEDRWDTIVWLDHRALAEAEEVTATGHRVLDFVGGVMSPEMEVPKLMWLKRHLPQSWARIGHLFDLADFLSWKATGSLARSQSTLVCKWTYLAHEADGWQNDFLDRVGLSDMREKGRLPERAAPIGTDLGPLTQEAADALGLTRACRVGVGLIDAHAGAVGVLGAYAGEPADIHRHLGLIAGTSSAVMALSAEPRPVAGVWGPYYGAVLPGIWLNEGGQSASGALLDHIIAIHRAGGDPTPALHAEVIHRVMALRETHGDDLAPRLHILPDFHGNRSPLADPNALGVMSGLDLDTSFDGLAKSYWRAAISVALGVRHILETLNAEGYAIDTLHVTGGHTRNPLLMELYADATGCTVHEFPQTDAMLLGTAMVAAAGAGLYPSVTSAAAAMRQSSSARVPDPAMGDRYARDYAVFLKMHAHRKELDTLIRGNR
jgi:FGGY-family pentulose kinase